ncbi:hypothetical protein [Streptomyces sp. NPDC090445]
MTLHTGEAAATLPQAKRVSDVRQHGARAAPAPELLGEDTPWSE